MQKANYKELKSNGFMPQVQKDCFSMRLRIAGGQITAKQLKKVYEIATEFGQGHIHMTARQSMEIPFIKLEDIETVRTRLAEAGLEPAAGGNRVRTVTACQGCTICPRGLIDAAGLARDMDERYYGELVPHKFKIGITGCRNNCLKAEENDLGIKGAMKPQWRETDCTYCGACAAVCPAKAISVSRQDKTLVYSETECSQCGRCVKACPVKAWEGSLGFTVYFGGTFGNNIRMGKQVLPTLFETADLHRVIEATMEFFREHGRPKERLAYTLERVGWDVFEEKLNSSLPAETTL